MKRVRGAFDALAPHARYAVIALGALVALGTCIALVATLERARDRVQTSVAALRASAQQMERHAAEIARLRSAPRPASSGRDLRSVIEAEAKAGGFTPALRVDATSAEEVRVIVASIAFPEWLAWLERLQAANVRVKGCRVEAGSPDGTVAATVTFVRTP